MRTMTPVRTALLAVLITLTAAPIATLAQQASPALPLGAKAPVLRDGQKDFDWEIGSWNTHLKRRLNPLTGSNEWAEYNGTTVVRPVWDGRANLVELNVSGSKGKIEGL